MFNTIKISAWLAVVLLFPAFIFGQRPLGESSPKRVSGCALLAHPEKYTGKFVEVVGMLHVGFETSNLTFSCSGNVRFLFSLYDADLKKYGFLTQPKSKELLDAALGETYPGEIINEGKSKEVKATLVGLFRCHDDFPSCEGANRNGGSSIIVRSARLDGFSSTTQ